MSTDPDWAARVVQRQVVQTLIRSSTADSDYGWAIVSVTETARTTTVVMETERPLHHTSPRNGIPTMSYGPKRVTVTIDTSEFGWRES